MKKTSIWICIIAILALANSTIASVNRLRTYGNGRPPAEGPMPVDAGPRPNPD